jgi:hypothetical protein
VADDAWRELGNDAYARADSFNPRGFAAGLGLLNPTLTYLPFPLAVAAGTQ